MADFYIGRQTGGWYPIILETPNHIVIEGVAHDKATLNPSFLQGFYANNINNALKLLTNRYWNRSYNYSQSFGDQSTTKHDGGQGLAKNMWISEYDSSEFFLLLPASRNALYRAKCKDLTMINAISEYVNGSEYATRPSSGYIYNESPTSLSLIYNGDGSGNSASYNYDYLSSASINKSSFSNTGAAGFNEYSGLNLQLLTRSATYVLFALGGPNNNSNANAPSTAMTGGRMRIYAMNRTLGTMTCILDFTGSTYQLMPAPSVPFTAVEGSGIKHTYMAQPTTTANFYVITRVWYDEVAPVTSNGKAVCTISYAGTPFTAADMQGVTGNRFTLMSRCTVITNSTGQRFLTITLLNYAEWNTTGTSEPLTSFKTWVFKIEADLNTLTPVQVYQHDDRMYEMIPLNDSHTRSIWIFPSYLAFVAWNDSANQYEIVNKIAITSKSVGVDELDRIWVIDYNNRVQLMTPYVPAKVAVSYELPEYTYQGTDIASYINVSAYDAFGNRITANVTLTIEGNNCLFTDSTTKKTITTISKAGGDTDVQVGITVTNSGYFRILSNTEV